MPDDTRMIEFAGRDWVVKSGGKRGPGPNYWSDSEQSVWVDEKGWLHLRIRKEKDRWYCAEVYTKAPTSYGLHRFYTSGRLDRLDPNVVFAPFLYKDDEIEIDIEFARWGETQPQSNAQYVIQPFDRPGNLERFEMKLSSAHTTHAFNWQAASIRFKSIHGHRPEPPTPAHLIHEWLYTGADLPLAQEHLRVHINLWLHRGNPPKDSQGVEMIVKAADLPAL